MVQATIVNGDCLDVLRTMPDASIDSIVTDPPYGLGFMGKKWDIGVPAVDVFAECLRVLKPGGHLLAFGGSRTYHRLAVAVEDAGFDIRDQIMWVYGSGFPKSQNVSKAIDKARADNSWKEKLLPDEKLFCDWVRNESGLTKSVLARICGSDRFYTGAIEIVNTATKESPRSGRRSMVPTAKAWEKLREVMAVTPPAWVEDLVKLPPKPAMEHPGEWKKGKREGTAGDNEWQGWGTALKPAHEPIVVARKPIKGTVAANVLAHGTGALNIDGCRVSTDDVIPETSNQNIRGNSYKGDNEGRERDTTYKQDHQGRFPANLIHDGSEEVAALFPDTKSGKPGIMRKGENSGAAYGAESRQPGTLMTGFGDAGSAARFFYCAKASKSDRTESGALDNPHPTVKPVSLMRYLVRLITPPGGVVLDPFTGSGSTGKAAVLEGASFIGIEREAEYMPIIEGRVFHALGSYWETAA